ncbi:hypothetical protein [Paenibacillus radicis (ex Xue et al. 2023)]|uniref:Uncharacterized protein n=1 Tax=Paenibacillus radicis (ex Xue et al. 2023) TaxID=2972489 RepID=A0ABT1YTC2_9BACL|nr:hypothetical protein [Paenibacillus radicis (ex Xue et al. 2023)]MCR8636423.1 hypothetical protein [Paenibacillus radicis (ex Xue et al. 2023)]
MQSITYSPGLTNAVRSLKQFDSQQLVALFKDSKWFEAFSLSAEEGTSLMKLFAKPSSDRIQKSNNIDGWS